MTPRKAAIETCWNIAAIAVIATLFACSSDTTGDQPDADANDGADTGEVMDPEITWTTAASAFEFVDPFFGSGGDGFSYGGGTPAAQLPVSPMRLGPDTCQNGSAFEVLHASGYNANDEDLFGFSHLRFVGTGVSDYGNLRSLPLDAAPTLPPGNLFVAQDKSAEAAEPGYYATVLPDEGIDVELTVDAWAGTHRYTFDGAGDGFVLWDTASINGSGTVETSETGWDGETLSGSLRFGGGYTGRGGLFPIYFEASFDPAPTTVTLWNESGAAPSENDSTTGPRSGALLAFENAGTIEMRVGISFVDADQARLHRQTLDGRTFLQIRDDARQAWEEKLGRVRIPADADPTDAGVFYSALYNIWRMPTLWEGTDGRYLGFDKEVHDGSDDGFLYYTDLSLWDTFRTAHPLYELIDPELQKDSLNSILTMQQQGGFIPRWPAAAGYTNGMLGASADHLFAGSALKGIDGVDYDAAFAALYAEATLPQPVGNRGGRAGGMDEYVEYGYVPDDLTGSSVSETLEYAYADASLANLADFVGETETAGELRLRSKSWRNLWDADSKFILPRFANGDFNTEIARDTSFGRSGTYAEGSAWHYRFYALHDLEHLVESYGAVDFETALEALFEQSSLVNPGPLSGLVPEPYYWAGNQPDIDSAYLFQAVGRPDRLAHWVNEIRSQKYGPGASGLPGNDDGGTLSGWYVLSALGIYPQIGTESYWTGQPLFSAVQFDTVDAEPTELRVDGDLSCCSGYGVESGDGPVFEVTHDQLLGNTLRFVSIEAVE